MNPFWTWGQYPAAPPNVIKVIFGGADIDSTDVNSDQTLPEVDNSSLKKDQKQ